MAAKRSVPEIRFKGFDGEWAERLFSELFALVSNNTLSRAELNYSSGMAKNVHYGDVLIKFGEVLDANTDRIPFVSDATVVDRLRKARLQSGDVIIADAAEDEMVGKCTELMNVGDQLILSGLHTIASRPTTPFATGFLGYALNAPSYHDQLLRLMQGTKVLSLSRLSLQDTRVQFPDEVPEQSLVGTYFQSLDSLITLRRRKHDKLTAVKKAMLHKMFPQDGADVPEIRFRGFSERWALRKFGEIVTEVRRPIEVQDSKAYELVTVKRRNEGVVSRGFLTGRDILVKNYSEVRTGDYIISKRQVIHGANGVVPPSLDGAIVSNEYLIAVSSECLTTDFLALLSKLPAMYRLYFVSSFGVDIEKMVFDVEDWRRRSIAIPTVEEQERITDYFTRLDALLALQQRELDKLKNLKKAYLDKIFV